MYLCKLGCMQNSHGTTVLISLTYWFETDTHKKGFSLAGHETLSGHMRRWRGPARPSHACWCLLQPGIQACYGALRHNLGGALARQKNRDEGEPLAQYLHISPADLQNKAASHGLRSLQVPKASTPQGSHSTASVHTPGPQLASQQASPARRSQTLPGPAGRRQTFTPRQPQIEHIPCTLMTTPASWPGLNLATGAGSCRSTSMRHGRHPGRARLAPSNLCQEGSKLLCKRPCESSRPPVPRNPCKAHSQPSMLIP